MQSETWQERDPGTQSGNTKRRATRNPLATQMVNLERADRMGLHTSLTMWDVSGAFDEFNRKKTIQHNREDVEEARMKPCTEALLNNTLGADRTFLTPRLTTATVRLQRWWRTRRGAPQGSGIAPRLFKRAAGHLWC